MNSLLCMKIILRKTLATYAKNHLELLLRSIEKVGRRIDTPRFP